MSEDMLYFIFQVVIVILAGVGVGVITFMLIVLWRER